MRKILFGCALGFLVTALAAFAWAKHAVDQPDSLAARSLHAVARAAVVANPLCALQQATGDPAACCPSAAYGANVQAVETSIDFEIPEEVIRAHAEERLRVLGVFPSTEIIVVEAPTFVNNGCCQASASCEVVVVDADDAMPGQLVCECRVCPAVPADCDEEEAPAYMPPAKEYADDCDDEVEGMSEPSEPLSFWLRVFRNILEEQDATEPADTIYPDDIGTPEEDPDYHQQYPGCPYTGSKRGSCCPGSCCPSGCCPQSGQVAEEASAPPCKDKRMYTISLFPPGVWVMPSEQSSIGLTLLPCIFSRGAGCCEGKAEEQNLGSSELKAFPKRPFPNYSTRDIDRLPSDSEIDTMEYRPSDARKGEFDAIPY